LLALAGLAAIFDRPVAATILTGAAALVGSLAFFDCAAASRVALAEERAPVAASGPTPQRSDDEHEVVAP
jgi:hypothetical protein